MGPLGLNHFIFHHSSFLTMTEARHIVRRQVGQRIKESTCTFCGGVADFRHRPPHVYEKCARCDTLTCSLSNHRARHVAMDLELWLIQNKLTRESAYALPALGNNSPIVGTPGMRLKDALQEGDRVHTFTMDSNLHHSWFSNTDILLFQLPRHLMYVASSF